MRSNLSASLAAMIACLLFAACGGGGGGGDGGAPAPSTPGPASTAVGVPNGVQASATIGAAGGNLSSVDGRLALTIPAGALASDTVIGIQPITNMAHGRIGSGYRLTPDGQSFLTPVMLTFTYTDQDIEGTSTEVLGLAFQTAAGFWQWAGDPTVDTAAKTVRVNVNHFSDYSNVRGLQIHPSKKTIKVSTSLGLKVMFCFDPDPIPGPDPYLTSLGYKCEDGDEAGVLNPISDWSVNGVPGGTAAAGTISGSGFQATYTAPATKPNANPVAASAKATRKGGNQTLLVSNITIVGNSWTGTGSSTSAAVNVTATVTWTLESTTNNVAVYRPAGSASAVVAGCAISPSSNTLNPASDGVMTVDFNSSPPTYHGSGLTTWMATWTCPMIPPFTSGVGAAFFGGKSGTLQTEAQGTVSPDGLSIQGTDTSADGMVTFNWNFAAD